MNDEEEEEDRGGPVVSRKKLGISKLAREISADSEASREPSEALSASLRDQDEGRPVYTKEHLQELKSAVPSAPPSHHHAFTENLEENETQAKTAKEIDVAAKFGEIVQVAPQRSHIPSAAEIREKKDRRARLAKEGGAEDFIALDDGEFNHLSDENEFSTVAIQQPQSSTVESNRLVPDDEDFAEGFEEYVDDGRIGLGKKSERDLREKKRTEIQELIEEAENNSDESDSEAERRDAYDATQAKSAMQGLVKDRAPPKEQIPPKITPLPQLADSLTRLQTSLALMQSSKAQLIHKMEELRQEKTEIVGREAEIQELLKESGEKYESLRIEAGVAPDSSELLTNDGAHNVRSLENIGTYQSPPNTTDAPSPAEMMTDSP